MLCLKNSCRSALVVWIIAAMPILLTSDVAVAETVQQTIDKVNHVASVGESLGYSQAAANLRYWLSARWGVRQFPTSAFQNNTDVLDHLRDYQRFRIGEGVRQRLRDGRLRIGQSTVLTWTDSMVGTGDLYFALGGFTVDSRVQVTVTGRTGYGNYIVRVDSWQTRLFDLYDWDPNQRYVFFDGTVVTGKQMIAVENAGRAVNFNVISEYATITRPDVAGTMVIGP